MKDRPFSIEQATAIFENTRTQLVRVLRHPILPQFVYSLLYPSLAGAKMVSDEEFEAGVQAARVSDRPVAIQAAGESARVMNFFCTPDGQMIIRLSHLRTDPFAEHFLPDLMAEALSYNLAKEKTLPLREIPDGSFLIFPHRTKADLIRDLQGTRVRLDLEPGVPAIGDLVVFVHGFKSVFFDRKSQRFHAIYAEQVMLEKTRTAIIQTILEILYKGMSDVPYSPSEQQYEVGLNRLRQEITALPPVFLRERAALTFMEEYQRRFGNRADFLKGILTVLYNNDAEQFLSGLNEKEGRAFIVANALVREEFGISFPSTSLILK